MAKNIELEQLVINKLTQEQFDSIEEKNPAELYFITDAEADGGTGAQVEEMPEATEMNAGQIVQYVGETITGTEATAVITQTVGNSLTDLKVNAEKFGKASGLTEAGSVEFVAEVIKDDAMLGEEVGTFSYAFNSDKFISDLISTWGENWWELTGGTDMFFVYVEHQWALSNSVPVLEETMGSQVRTWLSGTGDWGFYVSDDSQVVNNDYIPVSVVFGSTKWLQDTNEILPSDYGISYSGSPSNGDTLKVDYTPFVGGYEKGYFYVNQVQLSDSVVTHKWNQINVQPASKGNGGIEWVTKVDLPGDYMGDVWQAAPYYTIEGGLPDGTYEFYFSAKTTVDSALPLGEVIFKVLFTIDNKNMQANGRMGYVFDGNYMNDGNNIFSPDTIMFWNFFRKNDSDIILYYAGNPWASAVLAYNNYQTVPECFKLSAIKNTNTGDTYIATGGINTDGSEPEYQYNYSGIISLEPISHPMPEIPTRFLQRSIDINSDSQYVLFDFVGAAINKQPDCSELIICCASSSGGKYSVEVKNGIDSYIATVKEASGDLKNAQIGWCNSYYHTAIFLNVPDGFSDTVTVSLGMKGSKNTANANFRKGTPSSFTPLVITKVGGTINAANYGMILQHTGDSDDNYTSGYFYKATGEKNTLPASLDIPSQTPENVTIEVDVDKLIPAFSAYTGWDVARIREQLAIRCNWIYYNYETPYIYCSFHGNIHYEPIVNCFTISNLDTLENGQVKFDTENYQPGRIEIANSKWEQINVQPESEGGLTKEEADQTYLPLSGGTLTGVLNINPEVSDTIGEVLTLSYGENDVVIRKNRYSKSLDFGGATLSIGNLMRSNLPGQSVNIGSHTSLFDNIYVAQISSSTSYSDRHYLTVPNKDGTIATVEDIDAAVGDISTALTSILGE